MAKNQEFNFTYVQDQDDKSKFAKNKKGMPTIRCVCGLRILVIPDLKAMNRAIKNHISEHKKADYGLAFDSLEEFLTEQILMSGKQNEPAKCKLMKQDVVKVFQNLNQTEERAQ